MIKITLIILLAFAAVSCSDDDKDNSFTNYKSGDCGSDIVTDYNAMSRDCRLSGSTSSCNDSIDTFLNKYPGINCRAENRSPGVAYGAVVFITEGFVRSNFSNMNPAASGSYPHPKKTYSVNYKYGSTCSPSVISNYNSMIVMQCQPISRSKKISIEEVKNCSAGLGRFLNEYEQIFCSFRSAANKGFTKYLKESELKEHKIVMDNLVSSLLLEQDLEGLISEDDNINSEVSY